MLRLERLPSFNGVAAGAVATINVPLGPTYNSFILRTNADISSTATNLGASDWDTVFDEFRILIDGRITYQGEVGYLVKLAQFYGETLRAGTLPIFLSNPWARSLFGEDITAYGTAGGLSNMTIELGIKENQSVNELKMFAQQSAPRPFGKHLVLRKISRAFGSTGIDEIADVPRGAHSLIGLDVTHTGIDEVEILAAGTRVHDSDKETREQTLLMSGRVKQTGMTHVDFCPRNRVAVLRETEGGGKMFEAEAFPMAVNDFRVKLTHTSAPSNYDVYLREIHDR